jgi:CMP-N,N'-diacetyllegionaminic acid synthase
VNTLGVILARAGSVGLKDKHLLPLAGKRLIEHTFEHARSARTLTRVVVSTDCPRIRELASVRGMAVINRPAFLATSDASVQDVLLHAMLAMISDERFHADAVVTLYGNVPVRRAGVIDEAVNLLASSGCDSVRSFCPVGKWHPNWMSRIEGDTVQAYKPGSIHRRQDLEPLYLHDGAVVASSRRIMDEAMKHREDPHAFFGRDRRGVLCEMTDTVEVDTRRDLLLAEAILNDTQSQARPQAA